TLRPAGYARHSHATTEGRTVRRSWSKADAKTDFGRELRPGKPAPHIKSEASEGCRAAG
ncbi:hypothetical protein ABIF83_008063, partial [Bradyrhizobium ottawaense]